MDPVATCHPSQRKPPQTSLVIKFIRLHSSMVYPFTQSYGQRFLILEFDGRNQTETIVRWLKIDFFKKNFHPFFLFSLRKSLHNPPNLS